LKGIGFEVTTAEDGAVALENMKRDLPDVVVTDLETPNTGGVETLKQIRENWGLLPVIILTGFPDTPNMRRAMEFPPFILLPKPCPPEQLIQTIRSLQPQKTFRTRNVHPDRQTAMTKQTTNPREFHPNGANDAKNTRV
jgi:two-component system C4-dicarboxylate transport response regulator DctD